MRLALKHQILLAPAAVLLLMSLLLGFLQYSYWDLSLKRQASRRIATLFLALAEADLATQRMQSLALRLTQGVNVDIRRLEELNELHTHLAGAAQRILSIRTRPEETRNTWLKAVADLNPEMGVDQQRFDSALAVVRPQINELMDLISKRREKLREAHSQDVDALVARTTFVSIIVLGAAILLGIFLSLTLARRILKRIQFLSESAGKIARGQLVAPPAPAVIRDELDDLAVSINRMTDRLIRVVGTEKLLEGAEEERQRIAMDIHDQTLADLSGVLRGLQGLRPGSVVREEVQELEDDLQKAISNLREVMDNLHPQTLEILGLGAAVESHLNQLQSKGGPLDIHFFNSGDLNLGELPKLTNLTLYRIIIEAVQNVVKHAHANTCEVTLARQGKNLLVVVEDNGIGFDPAQVNQKGGRGLHNIAQRARTIRAEIEWGPSRFSSGTRFELRLPFSEPH